MAPYTARQIFGFHETAKVIKGVPQGTVLFFLFMNEPGMSVTRIWIGFGVEHKVPYYCFFVFVSKLGNDQLDCSINLNYTQMTCNETTGNIILEVYLLHNAIFTFIFFFMKIMMIRVSSLFLQLLTSTTTPYVCFLLSIMMFF